MYYIKNKKTLTILLTSLLFSSTFTERVKADGFSNPNIISQKQDHSFQRLISLSTSDIAGTCWEYIFNDGQSASYKFHSDGTFQSFLPTYSGGMTITEGEWRISSGVIMMRAIRYQVNFGSNLDWQDVDDTSWKERFIMRNGDLTGKESGDIYTPCDA
jgi:hypothetical protein